MTEPDPRLEHPGLVVDERWYQKAVFYEVSVASFSDANADGIGDLPGLIDKLDYLEWLGVDCLWLLPFFSSPLRDGGYDISDFFSLLPEYGDVGHAAELVEQCHRRGLRIIADLVMNHTSDAHPWFQESRQDRTNPKADWYVWHDDDQRWGEARVIFVDSEASNWSWDPQRGQYYWHRFFHHQPDLNYANPEVAEAMLDVVRFWLDIGLDGFRLDAVPYLFERDGTNGENLPETHEYLRRLRKDVDSLYPGKVLLAEANQWPTDVVDYFGAGDECHMCFHFPLMPRMFMALRREQRYPITEILASTPEVPDGCSWGIFLRNHDELTLEMVTDEERDYMYAEYANDPRMKVNVGIRRRLAPLLDNDRRVAELLHALLFSLPGSPVMYYGDEIGMGDNIYLGDRDGVRTPMQWSPDRNAGFSRAEFARLHLPPLMDPVYGYQAVNVEAALLDPSSLLHWVRRMLEVRRQHPLFGVGSFSVLGVENPSVLAFVREHEGDAVICVNNLSRFAQPAELQLGAFEGWTPQELLGRVQFPRIGELPYFVTLAPYGFYWFALSPPEAGHVIDPGPLAAALADHLPRQRWFDGGEGAVELRSVSQEVLVDGWPALVHVMVETGSGRWQLVLALRPAGTWPVALEGKPEAVVGELDTELGRALVYDALVDADLGLALLAKVAPDLEAERARPLLGVEQSNSSVIFDEAVILKLYRRLLDGPNPDAEVTRALAEAGFTSVAEPLGQWRMDGMDLAVVNRFLSNGTDGFHLALTSLRDLYGARGEPGEAGGDFAPDARRLGIITARMHVALAAAFGAGPADAVSWADEAERSLEGVDLGDVDVAAVRAAFGALRDLHDAGTSLRTHGDYHLGQVLRTDAGWFVLDFEGEPLRSLEERRRPTSPLRDVAGMLRSLHYAAAVALRQWNDDGDDEVVLLADAWERHNAFAFLEGYAATEGIDDLLPKDEEASAVVRRAFELEKAVYEVRYERAHRPEWVGIPLAAVARLVS